MVFTSGRDFGVYLIHTLASTDVRMRERGSEPIKRFAPGHTDS